MSQGVKNLRSGYAYQFKGKGSETYDLKKIAWRDSPDDDWEIVVVKGGRSRPVGARMIDGAQVTVWCQKTRGDERVFAQTLFPKGLER